MSDATSCGQQQQRKDGTSRSHVLRPAMDPNHYTALRPYLRIRTLARGMKGALRQAGGLSHLKPVAQAEGRGELLEEPVRQSVAWMAVAVAGREAADSVADLRALKSLKTKAAANLSAWDSALGFFANGNVQSVREIEGSNSMKPSRGPYSPAAEGLRQASHDQ